MKFSERLWQKIAPTYQAIVHHPFNIELADGTLDKDRFLFYMAQDAHYLVEFSRALAIIAGRTKDSKIITQFLNFALGALVAERELHQNFLPADHNFDHVEPSTACLGYTQFLIATAATGSLEEAVAAVLPCFWIYRDVGRHISTHTIVGNPYERWIDTYSCEEFSDATDCAIEILDLFASACAPHLLVGMEKAF